MISAWKYDGVAIIGPLGGDEFAIWRHIER